MTVLKCHCIYSEEIQLTLCRDCQKFALVILIFTCTLNKTIDIWTYHVTFITFSLFWLVFNGVMDGSVSSCLFSSTISTDEDDELKLKLSFLFLALFVHNWKRLFVICFSFSLLIRSCRHARQTIVPS